MRNAGDNAQAFTKQLVGRMVGDDLLVQEGKEQEREADRELSKARRQADEKAEVEPGQFPPRRRATGVKD